MRQFCEVKVCGGVWLCDARVAGLLYWWECTAAVDFRGGVCFFAFVFFDLLKGGELMEDAVFTLQYKSSLSLNTFLSCKE